MPSKKSNSPRPELSPLSLLRMLWKRKLAILIVWAVSSLVAGVIILLIPPVYRAETLILVESQKIPEKLVSPTVSVDLQDRLATISQQILSATRLQKIIEKSNLYAAERAAHAQEDVIEMMRSDIEIKLEKGWSRNRPGAIRVFYKGRNPAVVASVANEIGNLFIEENLKAREVQAEGTSEFIGNQLQEAKKRLEDVEAKVSQYKQEHSGELPGQELALQSALTHLQSQMASRQEAVVRAQQNKMLLENSLHAAEGEVNRIAAEISAIPTESAKGTTAQSPAHPADPNPPKRSEVLAAQLKALLERYGDQHPQVRAARRELARVTELEAKTSPLETPAPAAASGSAPPPAARRLPAQLVQAAGQAKDRVATLKTQIELAEQEIDRNIKDRDALTRQITVYQARLEKLPLREQEMSAVMRDYELAKAHYNSLYDRNSTADMAAEMERRQKAERFNVMDVARVPEKPFQPNRPLLIVLSSLLGLALGVAWGFSRELRQNAVLGEWELPADVLVLGRIPFIT